MADPNPDSSLEQTRIYRSGIDDVCEQFEASWSENATETIESWLDRVDPGVRQTLLKELLLIDIELRKRKGLPTVENDYLARFSSHRTIVQDAWIQVNQYLRSTSEKVDTFVLENMLGRGGMGEAWKAYDEVADRYVVLKFIPKEIQHIKEAVESVRDSFRKVHELQHQHICPVYGLFNNPDHGLYLAMKFVDGLPLDEYKRRFVEKHGKMSFPDIVQILWGIAKGLDYAHEKRVIHRDIKPQNIMISKKDGVQIIDFGLAEEIRTSMVKFSEMTMNVAGTRPYMAPEQWQGRMQDARTDQYALAVTAYELFSGHVPFQGSDVGILRECVLHDKPESIDDLPDHVNAALLKGLAKKRDDRFENCKAFIKAMATKPKESSKSNSVSLENISNPVDLPSDRASDETQPPVWVPQTMASSKKSSIGPSVFPGNRTKTFRFIVVSGIALLLFAGTVAWTFLKTKEKGQKTGDIANAIKMESPNIEETDRKVEPELEPSGDIHHSSETVGNTLIRTEPVFPESLRNKEPVESLLPELAEFIVKKLKRDIAVYSDGKLVQVPSDRPQLMPDKFERIAYIQFRPVRDHERRLPGTTGGWPCISSGFFHKDAPCCCSLATEDYRVLNRLHGYVDILSLGGFHFSLDDLSTLLQDNFPITGLHLDYVSPLPHWDPLKLFDTLMEFTAEQNDLTPKHLESLASHPKLWKINLSRSRFSPGTLKILSDCRYLSNLLLVECMLSQEDLADLGEIRTLAELNIKGTPVGDRGLKRLASNPRLKKIHIDSGTHLTAKGLRMFKEKHPKIEVLMPMDTVLPISFDEIPETKKEIDLSDILWETASVNIGSPGPFTLESNQGKRNKSLWAAAPSRLVFRPKKHWNTLTAAIALAKEDDAFWKRSGRINSYVQMQDDSSGTVYFVVKGDGKELYRSHLVSDSNELEISLDISNIDTLKLIVEDGGDGPRFDSAAWFSPKLSR